MIKRAWSVQLLPLVVLLMAGGGFWFWLSTGTELALEHRIPGTDQQPPRDTSGANPVHRGKLIAGPGVIDTNLPGAWPQFRGPQGTGISLESVRLARQWPAGKPRELWSIEVGEGYAGAAIADGRVYVMDYDRERQHDALRCLSLADGREVWRFSYPVKVKRNHGMSRTVPSVSQGSVIAMGPKCHVICLDAQEGTLRWGLDLVQQFGAKVPQWYAGQCPLIETNQVILAPGGKKTLLAAVDRATGNLLWESPNPRGWAMTHASVVPMEFAQRRIYLYCGSGGVAGVDARDGALLWETTDWKISIATVPSPVVLEDGKIFVSGGYNAGSAMLQLQEQNGKFSVKTLFRLKPDVFGATQQTPIYYQGHLYGIRPDGQFVCLDPSGRIVWHSEPKAVFGLGPFLLADGLIFAMNDTGRLTAMEATPSGYRPLAQAQILQGHESWGPMALAGGRLIARDFTRMICLELTDSAVAMERGAN